LVKSIAINLVTSLTMPRLVWLGDGKGKGKLTPLHRTCTNSNQKAKREEKKKEIKIATLLLHLHAAPVASTPHYQQFEIPASHLRTSITPHCSHSPGSTHPCLPALPSDGHTTRRAARPPLRLSPRQEPTKPCACLPATVST
jgi:hypothetical protein